MAQKNFGQLVAVTPEDDKKIKEFNYIQVGTSGDVAVRYKSGNVVIVKAGLLDRVALVPVGVMDEVLTTGTTATDVYVW